MDDRFPSCNAAIKAYRAGDAPEPEEQPADEASAAFDDTTAALLEIEDEIDRQAIHDRAGEPSVPWEDLPVAMERPSVRIFPFCTTTMPHTQRLW